MHGLMSVRLTLWIWRFAELLGSESKLFGAEQLPPLQECCRMLRRLLLHINPTKGAL